MESRRFLFLWLKSCKQPGFCLNNQFYSPTRFWKPPLLWAQRNNMMTPDHSIPEVLKTNHTTSQPFQSPRIPKKTNKNLTLNQPRTHDLGPRWWFQIVCNFTSMLGGFSFRRASIFFKGVETTIDGLGCDSPSPKKTRSIRILCFWMIIYPITHRTHQHLITPKNGRT